MSDFRKLHDRYKNDATFHQMVRAIEQVLDTAQLTPSEVREAAMFACYRFELMNPKPIICGDLILEPRGPK